MRVSTTIFFVWKLVLDYVIDLFTTITPDTAVRKDDVLYIRYRYVGRDYIVTLPFREDIVPLSHFVTAKLFDDDVTQQPGVPYTSTLPFIFQSDDEVDREDVQNLLI